MRILISVLTLFLLTAPGLFAQSSIELTHEGTASFVQARGSIDTIIFVDLLGSSEPEAVLLDDSGLQVYSLTVIPALLHEFPVESAHRQLTVADMTGDGAKDIGILWCDATFADTFAIAYWDGASSFTVSDTLSFTPQIYMYYYVPARPYMKVLDVTGDGVNEIVVSYDELSMGWPSAQRFEGRTVVFDPSFASVVADNQYPIRSIHPTSLGIPGEVFLSERRYLDCWLSLGPDWCEGLSVLELWFGADSTTELLVDNPPGPFTDCGSEPYETYASRRIHSIGPLAGDISESEVLSILVTEGDCVQAGEANTERYGSLQSLSVHRLVSTDSLHELWTMDITGEDWHDFVYLPEFPGYFFAFVDGEFRQFRGGDGSLFQASGDVPEGDLHWAKPFADSLYRLIAVDSNVVNFYRPDIVTSANDQPHVSLPESFVLSAPYPNPFNPTVSFSISLPRQTELTIAIYNTLGQRVATVFEGTLLAGERPFIWDGSARASGVYFIKAITDSETQTRKAVLVK